MEKITCKHCSAEYVTGLNIGNFLHSKCPRCGRPFSDPGNFDKFSDINGLKKVNMGDN